MRKYLRNITVGAALLLLAGSCTDKFEANTHGSFIRKKIFFGNHWIL